MEQLAPPAGAAATVHSEVTRIPDKIARELNANGGGGDPAAARRRRARGARCRMGAHEPGASSAEASVRALPSEATRFERPEASPAPPRPERDGARRISRCCSTLAPPALDKVPARRISRLLPRR